MDRLSSVLAAWKAGKLPSQTQLLGFIQWVKITLMTQMEDHQETLSPRGRVLVKDLYNVLDSLVYFSESKNSDNLIQKTIYRCIRLLSSSFAAQDQSDDLSVLRRPLLDLFQVVWSIVSSDSALSWTSVGSAALSEAAHIVGRSDANAASKAASAFESTKASWSTHIWPRLRDALFKISERAQEDESYHKTLSTFFDLFREWTFQTLGSAASQSSSASSSSSQVFALLRTVLERLANQNTVEALLSALSRCATSVNDDPKVRKWFEDGFTFLHRCLDEAGFVRSEDFTASVDKLKSKWEALADEDPTWKANIDTLVGAWQKLRTAISEDQDVQLLKATHEKMFEDIKGGIQGAENLPPSRFGIFNGFSWLWQDLFKVFIPSIVGMIRDIPIPRMEYWDTEMEFVLEQLDLSSLRIHPSHVHISNLAKVDIGTSEAGETKSTMSVVTRIKAQGVKVSLNKLPFWYRDKTASYGPSDYSGRISNFNIPPRGLDLDLQVQLIPANPGTSTSAERERRKAFHIVEHVAVTIVDGDNLDFDIEDCNHAVLLQLFKPVFVQRLRAALEKALTEQVRTIFEGLDSTAWDLFKMTQEYVLVGMGLGSSLRSALSDELDHIKHANDDKRDGTGTSFTSTGVIFKLRDPATGLLYSYAFGSEPQILGPEKKGPSSSEGVSGRSMFGSVLGTLSDIAMKENFQLPETVNGGPSVRSDSVTFRQAVELKAEKERQADSWESSAFDM